MMATKTSPPQSNLGTVHCSHTPTQQSLIGYNGMPKFTSKTAPSPSTITTPIQYYPSLD